MHQVCSFGHDQVGGLNSSHALYHDHISSSSASHPLGTTVRVQDLLSNVPVRKQTALKAPKTLHEIKSLLFAFAFARPDVRFSFKVLKGKTDRLNWTYAASLKDSLIEVATKIVGKEIAAECRAYTISSNDPNVEVEGGWEIQALLLSPDAGMSRWQGVKVRGIDTLGLPKARNHQYISIDGRPVGADRSTVKEIVKTYKRVLQQRVTSDSRPFLFMQIRCPPESYDVNIEPAKDEVLFFQPDLLLSLVERLFKQAYGELPSGRASSIKEDAVHLAPPHRNMYPVDVDGYEEHETRSLDEFVVETDSEENTAARKNPFTIAAMTRTVRPKKMDADGQLTSPDANQIVELEREVQESPSIHPAVATHRMPLGRSTNIPPPAASSASPIPYQNPGPPMRRRTTTARDVEDNRSSRHTSDDDSQKSPARTSLQAWLTPQSKERSFGSEPRRPADPETPHVEAANLLPHSGQRQRVNNTGLPSHGSPMSLGWGAGQRAFKSPLKRHSHGQTASVSNTTSQALSAQASSPDSARSQEGMLTITNPHVSLGMTVQEIPSFSTVSSVSDAELKDIMDFEHRKKAAIAHQRRLAAKGPVSRKAALEQASQSESIGSPTFRSDNQSLPEGSQHDEYGARFGSSQDPRYTPASSNPHQNRYLAALRQLSHSHPDIRDQQPLEVNESERSVGSQPPDPRSEKPRLADDDPRARLMKQRRKDGGHKRYRTKSSNLPLETTPPNLVTLNVVVTTDDFRSIRRVQSCLRKLACTDEYITRGRIETEDAVNISIDTEWQHSVREMVKAKYRSSTSEGGVITPHLKIAAAKIASDEC